HSAACQPGRGIGHFPDSGEVFEATTAHVSAELFAGRYSDSDLDPWAVGRSVTHSLEQRRGCGHSLVWVVATAQSRYEQAHQLVARDLAQNTFVSKQDSRGDVVEPADERRDLAARQGL